MATKSHRIRWLKWLTFELSSSLRWFMNFLLSIPNKILIRNQAYSYWTFCRSWSTASHPVTFSTLWWYFNWSLSLFVCADVLHKSSSNTVLMLCFVLMPTQTKTNHNVQSKARTNFNLPSNSVRIMIDVLQRLPTNKEIIIKLDPMDRALEPSIVESKSTEDERTIVIVSTCEWPYFFSSESLLDRIRKTKKK